MKQAARSNCAGSVPLASESATATAPGRAPARRGAAGVVRSLRWPSAERYAGRVLRRRAGAAAGRGGCRWRLRDRMVIGFTGWRCTSCSRAVSQPFSGPDSSSPRRPDQRSAVATDRGRAAPGWNAGTALVAIGVPTGLPPCSRRARLCRPRAACSSPSPCPTRGWLASAGAVGAALVSELGGLPTPAGFVGVMLRGESPGRTVICWALSWRSHSRDGSASRSSARCTPSSGR